MGSIRLPKTLGSVGMAIMALTGEVNDNLFEKQCS